MSAASVLQLSRAARRATFALLFAAVACGDATDSVAPLPAPAPIVAPIVAQIDITASATPLLVHDTRQLTARALSVDGFTLHDRVITWSSSDTTVAAVTPQGVVHARSVGRAVIGATAGVARAEFVALVEPVAVRSIVIARAVTTLAAGDGGTFGAILFAADGRVLFDRHVSWSSSDTSVLVVDFEGQARGVRTGTARVIAESEGTRAWVDVTVAPGPLGTEATWYVRVSDLVGAAVRCEVSGVRLRIAQRGALVEGEVVGGASTSCSPIPGAQPPYATPLPPVGAITGEVRGRTVTLRATLHRWTFEGTLSADGRTMEGRVSVVDPASDTDDWSTGIVKLRTGRFVAAR
ncbi:MAG: Ig-like domain-containing protein [Gemmatirosa sp.]